MTFARLTCLLLLLSLALPAWSADSSWRLEKDEDGIQVYSRAVEGWSIREIRAVTRVPARLSGLVAVLDDVGASAELNEFVASAGVEKRESATRYQVYTRTDMPWPLDDRDVLNQREITQDPATLAVTITDTAIAGGLPVKKGLVRILRSRQQWTLTPAAEGQVQVELRLLSDPAGPIPSSLINSLSVSTPFKTVAKLKELVRRPAYAQARLAFVKEPQRGS